MLFAFISYNHFTFETFLRVLFSVDIVPIDDIA